MDLNYIFNLSKVIRTLKKAIKNVPRPLNILQAVEIKISFCIHYKKGNILQDFTKRLNIHKVKVETWKNMWIHSNYKLLLIKLVIRVFNYPFEIVPCSKKGCIHRFLSNILPFLANNEYTKVIAKIN